nr:F-box/LRR-repeat protein At3g26922-like isoform X4 [Lolium perenne]
MTETSQDAAIKKASPASSDDRIGALPDALLQQILSSLPSRDAVRTCVLATRWRTLWKSVPSLRIGAAGERYGSAHALSKFVSHLLLLRDRTPLLECEINSHDSYPDGDTDEAFRYMELLVRYAVSCQARVLRVDVKEGRRLCLSDVSLLSDYLTSLELSFVEVVGRFLDFSSCPALKVLKLKHCAIDADRISSQSLTNLIIHDVVFCSNGRTRISAPSLITLRLDGFTGYTPLLEPVESLGRAFLRFEHNCDDYCENDNYFGDCGSESCDGCSYSKFYDKDDCVLLKDFSGLIYFIQHSPILERLTLQLESYEKKDVIEKEESYNPRSRFLVSKHLKLVEINCRKDDDTIHHIVKILGTHGVPHERINIKPSFWGLNRFSFEQNK